MLRVQPRKPASQVNAGKQPTWRRPVAPLAAPAAATSSKEQAQESRMATSRRPCVQWRAQRRHRTRHTARRAAAHWHQAHDTARGTRVLRRRACSTRRHASAPPLRHVAKLAAASAARAPDVTLQRRARARDGDGKGGAGVCRFAIQAGGCRPHGASSPVLVVVSQSARVPDTHRLRPRLRAHSRCFVRGNRSAAGAACAGGEADEHTCSRRSRHAALRRVGAADPVGAPRARRRAPPRALVLAARPRAPRAANVLTARMRLRHACAQRATQGRRARAPHRARRRQDRCVRAPRARAVLLRPRIRAAAPDMRPPSAQQARRSPPKSGRVPHAHAAPRRRCFADMARTRARRPTRRSTS
jgi:hypothetical protein